jgi:hypothetical protein
MVAYSFLSAIFSNPYYKALDKDNIHFLSSLIGKIIFSFS